MFCNVVLFGEGSDWSKWIILDKIKLLNTVTLPIGVMFLPIHVWIDLVMESILFRMFNSVMFSMFKVSYSIPRAVKENTHSRSFSLQKRLSVFCELDQS